MGFNKHANPILIAIVLFLFISVTGGHASTINAKSASLAHVSIAISTADDGDTVMVPAGEVAWDSQLVITKNIQLIGAGSDKTLITATYESPTTNTSDSRCGLIYFNPDNPSASQTFRISGFLFDLDLNCGAVFMRNHSLTFQQVRIDNNIFKNTSDQRTIIVWGQFRGVIDSNNFDNTHSTISTYGSNKTSWDDLTYSFGTDETLFYEDNILTNLKGCPHSGGAGGRYTARYNTYTTNMSKGLHPWYDAHGNQATGNHSAMATEIYGNVLTHSYAGSGATLFYHRGGKAVVFDNSMTVAASAAGVSIREEYDDATYQPPATGPDGQPQHVSDSYYWNNIKTPDTLFTASVHQDYFHRANNIVNDPPVLVENVTHWQQRDTFFDGAVGVIGSCGYLGGSACTKSGIGRGSLNDRPSTCAEGVAYWATDAGGDWNRKNKTENDGCLYKCTSTNTWELYYIPYNYPHPLRGPNPPNLYGIEVTSYE